MTRKNSRKKIRRATANRSAYENLEARRMLATTASFAGGTLLVDLGAANDIAIVDVNAGGNITINGSDQINVGGSNTTVAATSVSSFESTGTPAAGQDLSLVGNLPALNEIATSNVDTVSIQGSYSVDEFTVVAADTLMQSPASTLTVALDTNIEALGDIALDSASNNFAGRFFAEGGNVSVQDVDEIELGTVTATGNFTIEASSISSLFSPVDVAGNTEFNTVNGVSFFLSPIDTNNLTISATSDLSTIYLDMLDIGADLDLTAGSIEGSMTWDVVGNTTITSIATRYLSGDAVALGNVDLTTTDYTVVGWNGDVVIGDATVSGNADISGLRVHVEQPSGGGDGGIASSNAGGATLSVAGDTTITSSGSVDAENSTINSDDLTIVSAFNDVILGTATTVIGNLNISAGGMVDGSTVTVGGNANIDAIEDIAINLIADGNATLDSDAKIILEGLSSNSAWLLSAESIENLANAAIDIQSTLIIEAPSASLGTMPNDSLLAARMIATVDDELVIEQESNVRLLDISATDLSVTSTGTVTNRNDATIDVAGDASFSGTNVIIGQTVNDTFNAGRLSFDAVNAATISENSDTEIFGTNSARTITIQSDGDITDDDNSVIDVAFSTMFDAANVTIGDSANDTFNTRTLSFTSPGHVDVSEDSRIFLTNINDSDQLTLTSTVSILDSPTTQVNVTGEASFHTPYMNIGDVAGDVFNAGSIAFNSSDTVNLTENSDTNFSGTSDVRLAIVSSDGIISNNAGASFEATSSSLTASSDITLGNQTGDHIDIDRLRFTSPADVMIEQDDSIYIYGDNTADTLQLFATGAIGDSGTASFSVANNTLLSGTSIWVGEQATDTFNSGSLTIQATGSVIIGENSLMLLEGDSSAFRLTLSSDSAIEDDDNAETLVTNSATFSAGSVTIGDTATDCFLISQGSNNLTVNASTSNVVIGCQV